MWKVTAQRVNNAPKFQCGATRTKGPACETLAYESTTSHCNLHLEDKPTAGKPVWEILATKMNEKLDKKMIFDNVLQPPLPNGHFLKLWRLRNLTERTLEPIFDVSKPRDKHSVHHDKSSQE